MKKTAIIYRILGLGIVITTTFMGGVNILYYVDFGSLLFVLGLGFILSLVSHGAHDFFSAYRTAIIDSKTSDTASLKKALIIINGFGKNIMIGSILLTLTGLLAVLIARDDIEQIAAGTSLSFITIFYGLIFILLIVYPFTNHLLAELAERE